MKQKDIKRRAVISDSKDQQKDPVSINTLSSIKQKLNILKYYQDQLGIKTTPNSKGYITALCPFHKDSNPSFSANVKSGNWICRGACDKRGSIFIFHKKKNGYKTTDEATRNLARLAGLTIKKTVVSRYD
jgi:DNA primase